MKRSRVGPLGALGLCSLVLSCGPHWRTVDGDDGRFSVEMPGPPERRTDVVDTPDGQASMHSYVFLAGRWNPFWAGLYIVGYWDAAEAHTAKEEVDRLLRFERDRILRTAGATALGDQDFKILSEAEVTIGDSPGLELEIEGPYGGHERARVYYVAGRLYVLMASDDDTRVRRFLESFRLEEL